MSTLERPPQLLPVANKPLLLHALDAIEAAGLSEATVIADKTAAPEVRAALSEDGVRGTLEVEVRDCPEGIGLSSPLSCVRDFVQDQPFLLHLGDSLQKGGLELLVADADLDSSDARVLTRAKPQNGVTRLVDASVRPRVEPLRRLWEWTAPPEHAGVYVLGSDAVDVAVDAEKGGASPRELGLTGLIQALDQRGGCVETRNARGSWRLGHRREGWLEGNRLALEGLEAQIEGVNLSDTDIQGNVVIHPTAEIRSSVLRGPVVIGPMARIIDAYVGPYSSIGAGVFIEAAEIEHSIVLPGASIRYLGGRLEASIIGSRARVFRDFRLPKALRLNVGDGAEVVLA